MGKILWLINQCQIHSEKIFKKSRRLRPYRCCAAICSVARDSGALVSTYAWTAFRRRHVSASGFAQCAARRPATVRPSPSPVSLKRRISRLHLCTGRRPVCTFALGQHVVLPLPQSLPLPCQSLPSGHVRVASYPLRPEVVGP
jgi:hypothetical protein